MNLICKLFGHAASTSMRTCYAVRYSDGRQAIRALMACGRCGLTYHPEGPAADEGMCTHDHHRDLPLLFVYGTLKRGYGNHRLLESSHFVGHDDAPGIVFGGGVPVCQPPMKGGDWVKGEVYKIDRETLRRCDALEGHPRHYTRTPVELRSGRLAFIYYYHHATSHPRIASGEWKRGEGERW